MSDALSDSLMQRISHSSAFRSQVSFGEKKSKKSLQTHLFSLSLEAMCKTGTCTHEYQHLLQPLQPGTHAHKSDITHTHSHSHTHTLLIETPDVCIHVNNNAHTHTHTARSVSRYTTSNKDIYHTLSR